MTAEGKRIAVVAGRSGGHIVPGLVYARQLMPSGEIIFFSTATSLDKSLLSGRRKCTSYFLSLSNFPRKKFWRYPFFIVEFIFAFFKSIWLLRKSHPEVLISMGGYISIPVVVAAWFLRIPVDLFELNATPGRAIKVLVPFARSIHICFSDTKKFLPAKKVVAQPYPLRFTHKDCVDPQQAKQQLGLPENKKAVFIIGGSQGSRYINKLMKEFVLSYKEQSRGVTIIHQAGVAEAEELSDFYEKHGVLAQVFAYKDNLQVAYSAADIIICRAGAGSLFEVAFFNKPALVIPLEGGTTSHQLANAVAMRSQVPHLIDILRQQDIIDDRALFYSWLLSRID